MGIVGMDGLIRGHVECHALALHAPRVAAVPVPVLVAVGFGVFEIPVLHQFGIQSAVGCVIQVFKEHANQVLTDGFRPAFVHGNPCIDRLQSGKPGRVVLGTFAPQRIEGGTVYAMAFHAFQYAVGYFQGIPRNRLVADLHRVSHRHTPVFHGKLALFRGHEIFLGRPFYQVGGRSIAYRAAFRVQVPETVQPSVLPVLYQTRLVHVFPSTEVTPHKDHSFRHVLPVLPVRAPDELHAAPPVVVGRGIREDINGIGLCRPYGTWQSLHEAKCHKRFQDIHVFGQYNG